MSDDVAGHRQRLKQRLLDQGDDALADYELLELALFYALPRRDVKPIAKQLLHRFATLEDVLRASPEALRPIIDGESVPTLFRLLEVLTRRLARGKLRRKMPLLIEPEVLREYCQAVMSALTHEEFRVFWLDSKGYLIRDEVHRQGTLDRSAVYPRELVRRGIEVGAASVVLAHNHPSGDPSPSQADIRLTHTLIDTFAAAEIQVIDHVVIGHERILSFWELGLLDRAG